MNTVDYYKVLRVDPSAEPEIITAAYRKLAEKYHPDHDKSLGATRRMQEINEAYAVLSDPMQRRQYDELRAAWCWGTKADDPHQSEKSDHCQERTQPSTPPVADVTVQGLAVYLQIVKHEARLTLYLLLDPRVPLPLKIIPPLAVLYVMLGMAGFHIFRYLVPLEVVQEHLKHIGHAGPTAAEES